MATYIVLSHFTDQGIRGVEDSPKRAAAFKAAATKAGVDVKAFYWTLGSYDMVSILEAPNVETVTALGLSVGKRPHRRVQRLIPAVEGKSSSAPPVAPMGTLSRQDITAMRVKTARREGIIQIRLNFLT